MSQRILPARRPGVTLLELVVVLAIIGLGLTLAAPRFLSHPRKQENAIQRVIDGARREAVRRAGAILLSFEANGQWTVEATDADAENVSAGNVDWPYTGPMRLNISALGACTIDATDAAPLRVDPVRCALQASRETP
jgi:prepilin-type N-terminal cleavage/methylation domain-containing protein